MTTKLSVNLNAVALLRNRRSLPWPSVEELGRIALQAGADGLTVHPRPDERHTRATDLPVLRALIDDEFPDREFNIEGYPTPEFLKLVDTIQPEQVTLVPDNPDQETSDHGWDFAGKENFLRDCVQWLKERGFRVSLFCDPDASEKSVDAAKATGTDRVELYTGPYGGCFMPDADVDRALCDLERTAGLAMARGMRVNAGHDLTVENVPALVAAIPDLAEVSIGHGLTADALVHGMAGSVERFMKALGR